jgi:hypothetical protein
MLLFKSKGEYYMGDHLGKNLTLTLLPTQSYFLTWHGCEGLYGAAIGKWRIQSDHLVLEPIDQTGWLAEHSLTLLQIRLVNNTYPALIPEADMPNFLKDGVEDGTCFRPVDLIDWR